MIHEVEPEGVEEESKGGGGAPPSPLGAVIHKRPAPEASCARPAQGIPNPPMGILPLSLHGRCGSLLSASVSAQTK